MITGVDDVDGLDDALSTWLWRLFAAWGCGDAANAPLILYTETTASTYLCY